MMTQQYIRQLEEAGVLHEITGQARNRVYRADCILEAIEAPPDQAGRGEGRCP